MKTLKFIVDYPGIKKGFVKTYDDGTAKMLLSKKVAIDVNVKKKK